MPNPYLDYLIDYSFQRVNTLFVLSFENTADRKLLTKYHLVTVEIKDYNVMSEGQNIFDQPVKNAVKKAFENLRLVNEMIARLVAY